MRGIFATLLGLAFLATAATAMACVGVQSYEHQVARWSGTSEEIDAIIDRSEVIVDGVISAATDGPARMRTTKVWKGAVGAEVPFHLGSYGCELPPLFGTEVRFAGRFENGRLRYRGLPLDNAILDQKLHEYELKKPIIEAERARQMEALRAKTEALAQAAATGDVQARLDFAAHLLSHNQHQRAQEVADALRRDGLKLAPFGKLTLTGERKDWSDLKRIHYACTSYHENLDGAVFDRADFAQCAFRYSSFRNASFRGTDLTGSYFQDSDLTGATYDCATKLPEDLDPVAAGMINAEGSCARP